MKIFAYFCVSESIIIILCVIGSDDHRRWIYTTYLTTDLEYCVTTTIYHVGVVSHTSKLCRIKALQKKKTLKQIVYNNNSNIPTGSFYTRKEKITDKTKEKKTLK